MNRSYPQLSAEHLMEVHYNLYNLMEMWKKLIGKIIRIFNRKNRFKLGSYQTLNQVNRKG